MRLIALVTSAITASFALTAPVRADENTRHFNVAPGTCSGPIAVAADNTPVSLMGANYEAADVGVGHVTILRKTASVAALSWAGVDSIQEERGFASASNPPGARIMYMDGEAWVDVKTAPNTHVEVCNSASNPDNATGYLTFMYL